MVAVSGTPSASITSSTISPQAAAAPSYQFTCAVERVAGVMVDVDHETAIEPADAGTRELAALEDDGDVERLVDGGGDPDALDPGSHATAGGAGSQLTIATCLPSAESASASASSDPMASPSGRR